MTRVIHRLMIIFLMCLVAGPVAAEKATSPETDPVNLAAATSSPETIGDDVKESSVSLSRDPGSAVTRSFTIEGEDRISISFDRPSISLDLDPRKAPGLGWQDSWEKVDVYPAITGRTALAPLQFLAQPWLGEFAQGDVVVFSPDAPDMTSWHLTIVDSRGLPAYEVSGEGAPPGHLSWDGRRQDGLPAWPGLIYSYVMETVDPAGNQRTFSGRGFQLPSYRLTGSQEDVLVMAGDNLGSTTLMQDTASWLNQAPGLTQDIEIRATARSNDQARKMARTVATRLSPLVCGEKTRLKTVIKVVSDAPDQGVVEIASNIRG